MDETTDIAQAAHRRIDDLKLHIVKLEAQIESQSNGLKKLEDVPTRLTAIETSLHAIERRLPQQAPPISPWAIMMTILGWVVSLILAVVAWSR